MNQICNPFEDINPLNRYNQFKILISQIKDKKDLLDILRLIEKRLNEL